MELAIKNNHKMDHSIHMAHDAMLKEQFSYTFARRTMQYFRNTKKEKKLKSNIDWKRFGQRKILLTRT